MNGMQLTSPTPPGFSGTLHAIPTTANASPTGGDLCVLLHRIEGVRIAGWHGEHLPLVPITISFWFFSATPGLYSGSVLNGANNRSYTFNFTVNAASVWEYKTVTIPGDATGTWATDTTTGMTVNFSLLVTGPFATAPGTWTAGNFYGTAGTVNAVASTGNGVLHNRRHRPPRHASPDRRAKSEYHAALRSGVGDVPALFQRYYRSGTLVGMWASSIS